MIVKWTRKAKRQLQQTVSYIQRNFGDTVVQNYLYDNAHIDTLLSTSPNIGPAEPLLNHRGKMYRSIVVNSRNKIVYSVDDNAITVAALWDTRREPQALANELD